MELTLLKPVNIILIAAALTTSLTAGLFYGWSCSVIPGLARVPDSNYISVMQSVNRAILNPVFFAGFMGALLLLPVATLMHYGHPLTLRFWLLLAATLLYAAGTFGVTMLGNVPLNNMLDKFDLATASAEAIARQRAAFEQRWVSLNTVRTVFAVLAALAAITACLSPHRN